MSDKDKLSVKLTLVKGAKSKVKAFATIKFDMPHIGDFVLNHISVVDGSRGLFVSLPSRVKEAEGGKKNYYDHFHPITKEGRQAIQDLIMEEYEKQLGSI